MANVQRIQMSKTIFDVAYDIFIALVTGGYSGWVVTRYFNFSQETKRAIDAIMKLFDLHEEFMNAPPEQIHDTKITWLVMPPAVVLRNDGHPNAAKAMTDIGAELEADVLSSVKRFQVTDLHDFEGRRHAASVSSMEIAKLIPITVKKIVALRPNPISILFGTKISGLIESEFRKKKQAFEDIAEYFETGNSLGEIRRRKALKK